MNKLLKAAIPALVATAFAGAAVAQAPAPSPERGGPRAEGRQGHHGMQGQRGSMNPGERAEARLAYVKTALKITPAQEPQWNAYASFIRKNAGEIGQRFEQRRAEMQKARASGERGGERPNAVQRLERQQAMHAEANKRLGELLAVQKPLYDVLTPEQRKVADEVLSPRGGARGMHAGFRRG